MAMPHCGHTIAVACSNAQKAKVGAGCAAAVCCALASFCRLSRATELAAASQRAICRCSIHPQRMPWMCTQPCGALLGCEHPCRGTCGACLRGWVCQELGLGAPALPNLATRQEGSTLDVQLPAGTGQLALPAADQLSHAACKQVCGRSLFCGHSCEAWCHQGSGCPPCRKPCAVHCSHSACRQACGEACPPCAEPCTWECEHQVSSHAARCPANMAA